MKIFNVLVIICLMLNLASPAIAMNQANLDSEAIDSYIEKEMQISSIPGLSLGIIQDGEIIYLQGYGKAGNNLQVSPNTPMVIGSLSKSLTSVTAIQLVEDGKIELDSPLQSYLPWFTMQGEYDPADITLRHLLNQTSGIPNTAGLVALSGDSLENLEAEVKALSSIALTSRPGDNYIYSNANYDILALIIDQITTNGYRDYLRNNLFEPLEMQDSFLSREEGKSAGMSEGHTKWFGIPLPTDIQYLDNSLASGFIISSAEDMCRYLLMHLNSGSVNGYQLLTENGIAELHSPGSVADGVSPYAMGLVARDENGKRILLHDGAIQGFNSAMAFSPEEQWGVIILTNVNSLIEQPSMDIALGVSSFLKGQIPENSSRAPGLIYLAAVILLVSLLLLTIRSIILLPKRWDKRTNDNRPQGFFGYSRAVFLPVLLELFLPFMVFLFLPAGAGFPLWKLLALFHPDLVYGLLILSVLLVIKAAYRVYLGTKTLKQSV